MRLSPDRPLGVAPATILDYRELARRRLPRQLFDYIDGGAYEEATLRANVADLQRVLLRQVVMRDVSSVTQAVRGARPAARAPGGARAGRTGRDVRPPRRGPGGPRRHSAGIPFVESTVSICGIEEVARATPAPPWFQLYVMRDRGYAEDLMARAHAVGAPVLVLTVDLAVVGARHRDTRNGMGGRLRAVGTSCARRAICSAIPRGSATWRSAGGRSPSATSSRRCPRRGPRPRFASGSTRSSTPA